MEVTTLFLVGAVVVLLACLFAVRFSATSALSVFEDLNIDRPPASNWFGHFLIGVKHGVFDAQTKFYSQFKDKKVYGWLDFRTPAIIVCDLDLIKDVMVKHFNNFTDRRQLVEFDPPFHESMLTIGGEHWKKVRNAVSPTFSTGRIKKMSRHVKRKVESLLYALDDKCSNGQEIELKDIMSRFTMDTIASTAFGLDIDSVRQPEIQFAEEAKSLMRPNMVAFLAGLLSPRLGRLFRKLGFPVVSSKSTKFMGDVIDAAIEVRKISKDAGKMNDFLDLVINAEKEDGETLGTNLTRSEIHGQAILFIFAGYDTVSTVLSFTLFMLAMNPECMRRAQAEVRQSLTDDTEIPDHDVAQSLSYLDQCVSEAIRMFPPAAFLDRVCTEDITIQGVKFPKGMNVMFPCYAIHMDPDIWEEPSQYKPERFEPGFRDSRHQFSYLPFGHGPRNCIGMRLAQVEIKMALAAVLRRFNVVPCDKTVYPVKLEKLQTYATDGLWVKLEKCS